MNLCITGTHHRDHPDVVRWMRRWGVRFGVPTLTVVGCANHVDAQAYIFAVQNGWPVQRVRADWEAFGKRAGNLRNQAMIELCTPDDWLLAFPCPLSRGTWDCLNRGRALGMTTAVSRRLLEAA